MPTFAEETSGYANVMSAPQQSIAQHKVLTAELSDRFSEITRQFEL